MAGETMRSRNPAGHAGLLNNLLAFFTDLAGFVESRVALFAKESKILLLQMLVLVACLLAALMFFAFGYVFLIVGAVVTLARVVQISWVWVALIVAGLHFLLAIICLLIARSRMIKSPYRELGAELKEDREWLRNLEQTKRPTN
jgi:uncharacterized membrane protein YqjE